MRVLFFSSLFPAWHHPLFCPWCPALSFADMSCCACLVLDDVGIFSASCTFEFSWMRFILRQCIFSRCSIFLYIFFLMGACKRLSFLPSFHMHLCIFFKHRLMELAILVLWVNFKGQHAHSFNHMASCFILQFFLSPFHYLTQQMKFTTILTESNAVHLLNTYEVLQLLYT